MVPSVAGTAVEGIETEVLDAATGPKEVGFRVAPSVAETAAEGLETEVTDAVTELGVVFPVETDTSSAARAATVSIKTTRSLK